MKLSNFQLSPLVTQKSLEILETWKPLAEATFKQTASEARARLQARRKQRSSVLSALAVLAGGNRGLQKHTKAIYRLLELGDPQFTMGPPV